MSYAVGLEDAKIMPGTRYVTCRRSWPFETTSGAVFEYGPDTHDVPRTKDRIYNQVQP
jgi:hypothetical protein